MSRAQSEKWTAADAHEYRTLFMTRIEFYLLYSFYSKHFVTLTCTFYPTKLCGLGNRTTKFWILNVE